MGYYESYDFGRDDANAISVDGEVKFRFASAKRKISPFVYGGAGYRTSDAIDDDKTEDFEELIVSFGGGCDFMLNETLAIVVKGAYQESEEIDGGQESADGVLVMIGMKGYWMPESGFWDL
jgi:hypothetical protein